MAAVEEHYEKLLADHYSWMSGGWDQKAEQNRKFFKAHQVRPVRSAIAVDLGAGCGFQSIPPGKVRECHQDHSIAFHLTGDLVFTRFPSQSK